MLDRILEDHNEKLSELLPKKNEESENLMIQISELAIDAGTNTSSDNDGLEKSQDEENKRSESEEGEQNNSTNTDNDQIVSSIDVSEIEPDNDQDENSSFSPEQTSEQERASNSKKHVAFQIWNEAPETFGEKVIYYKSQELLDYFSNELKGFIENKLKEYDLDELKEHNKYTLNFLQVSEKIDDSFETVNDDENSILEKLLPFNLENYKLCGWNLFKCFWIWYEHFLDAAYNECIASRLVGKSSISDAYDRAKNSSSQIGMNLENQLGGMENMDKCIKKAMDEVENIKNSFDLQDEIMRNFRGIHAKSKNIETAERSKNASLEKIKEIEANIEKLKKEIEEKRDEKKKLDKGNPNNKEKLDKLDQEINDLNEKLKNLKDEKEKSKKKLDKANNIIESADSESFDYIDAKADIAHQVARENCLDNFESQLKNFGFDTKEFMWQKIDKQWDTDDKNNTDYEYYYYQEEDDDESKEAPKPKPKPKKKRVKKDNPSKVDRHKYLPRISHLILKEKINEDNEESYHGIDNDDDEPKPGTLKYLLSVNSESIIGNKFALIDKKYLFLLIYIDFLEDYEKLFPDGTKNQYYQDAINTIKSELKLALHEKSDCELFLQSDRNVDITTDLGLEFSEDEKELEYKLNNFTSKIGIDRDKLKKFKRHSTLDNYIKENEKQSEQYQQKAKSEAPQIKSEESEGKKFKLSDKLLTDPELVEALVPELSALQGSVKEIFTRGKMERNNFDFNMYKDLLSDAAYSYKNYGKILGKDERLRTDKNKFFYLRFVKGYCLRFLFKYKEEIAKEVAQIEKLNSDEEEETLSDKTTENDRKMEDNKETEKNKVSVLSGSNKLQIIAINLLLAKCNEEYERIRQILIEKLKLEKAKRIELNDKDEEKNKPEEDAKPEEDDDVDSEEDDDVDSEEDDDVDSEEDDDVDSEEDDDVGLEEESELPQNNENAQRTAMLQELNMRMAGNKQSYEAIDERKMYNIFYMQNAWRYLRSKYRIMLMFISKKVGLSIKTYREADMGDAGKDFYSTILDKINLGDSMFINPDSDYIKAYLRNSYKSRALIKHAVTSFERLASDLNNLQERYQDKYLGSEYVESIKDRHSIIKAGSIGEKIIDDDDLIIDKIPLDAIGKL